MNIINNIYEDFTKKKIIYMKIILWVAHNVSSVTGFNLTNYVLWIIIISAGTWSQPLSTSTSKLSYEPMSQDFGDRFGWYVKVDIWWIIWIYSWKVAHVLQDPFWPFLLLKE